MAQNTYFSPIVIIICKYFSKYIPILIGSIRETEKAKHFEIAYWTLNYLKISQCPG